VLLLIRATPGYNAKTRIGNWYEDKEAHETKVKDYMEQKNGDRLVVNQTQSKFAKAYAQVSKLNSRMVF
jgi:hypothetical protein